MFNITYNDHRKNIFPLLVAVTTHENTFSMLTCELKKTYFSHLINSSALPDKLFHPRHQPIILYIFNYFIYAFKNKATNLINIPNFYGPIRILPPKRNGPKVWHVCTILSAIFQRIKKKILEIFVKIILAP